MKKIDLNYIWTLLKSPFGKNNNYNTLSCLVTGCNPNDLDIWADWCRLGLQFVVYKSAEQEWSFIN